MRKQEFLTRLEESLAGLPREDVAERLAFYEEMIDDRMEEGLPEEEAVAAAGPIEDIVTQTVSEVPLTKIVRERVKTGSSGRGWVIVLLILGFPVWFPLLAAAGAVVFSLYIVLWALVISLWAVEVSLWAAVLGCIAVGVVNLVQGNTPAGLAALGAALVCAGLSVFLFWLCKATVRGLLALTKKMALGMKTWFIRKETEK